MSRLQDDPAFRALKETAEKLDLQIPPTLLAEIYAIQREHQFEKDRSSAIKQMEAKILSAVDWIDSFGSEE
ncbi:MAG: hypothetical protein KF800_17470 [Lysobacter sp.]|nr:hypothetical protein [Lysobacter sp.]